MAVESFHEAGYIHRDINFKNIVFGLENEPQDRKMRLKDVTYGSDFFLIGANFTKKSNKIKSSIYILYKILI